MHFDLIVVYIVPIGQLQFFAITNKITSLPFARCIEIENHKRPANRSNSDDLVKTSR